MKVQGFEVNTVTSVRGKRGGTEVRVEDWELRVLIDGVPQVPVRGPKKPKGPKGK